MADEVNYISEIRLELKSNCAEIRPIGMTQKSLESLMSVAGVGEPRRSLSEGDCKAIAAHLKDNPIYFDSEHRTSMIKDFFERSRGVTVIGLE
jgi:hypothetical protein